MSLFQGSQRPPWSIHVGVRDYLSTLRLSIFPACRFFCWHRCETLMVSSKWFMQSIGHQGLNNLLAAYSDKSADAVCTFAYSPGPGHEPVLFQGRTRVRSGR